MLRANGKYKRVPKKATSARLIRGHSRNSQAYGGKWFVVGIGAKNKNKKNNKVRKGTNTREEFRSNIFVLKAYERVTKRFCNPRISIAKDPLRCNS